MCRLLAWVATHPRSAEEIIGTRELTDFTNLAHIHRDGWGMAWWSGRDPQATVPEIVHSTACAADDDGFRELTRQGEGDAGILHLRWATPGMSVTPLNCHPFWRDGLALAHNGGIYPLSRLHEILPPEWEAEVAGTTDSERYLLAVVAGRERTGKPVTDVLVDVVGRLYSEWMPSSLNALCLTPDSVLVVSAYDPQAQPPVASESADEYYALRYRESPEGVVVSSSGYAQPAADGWRRLDNMTLLEIRRTTATLSFHTLPFDAKAKAVAAGAGRRAVRTVATDAADRR